MINACKVIEGLTVRSSGGSHIIVIPKTIVHKYHIEFGDIVDVTITPSEADL